MMNTITTLVGGGAIAMAALAITNPLFPEAKFMTVHNVTYENGAVTPDRTVHGFTYGLEGIADWRVTVVAVGQVAPSCATIPGPDLHQGWSEYRRGPRGGGPMPYDVWVGDEGCLERLSESPGKYREHVTWTPRDGSPPVTAIYERTIP